MEFSPLWVLLICVVRLEAVCSILELSPSLVFLISEVRLEAVSSSFPSSPSTSFSTSSVIRSAVLVMEDRIRASSLSDCRWERDL